MLNYRRSTNINLQVISNLVKCNSSNNITNNNNNNTNINNSLYEKD
jgi:hypothetical protein